MTGLLIVNADDWGAEPATTDAIARCFERGRVTSATGMVYMADSARAAELARAHGLPVGLHINLTTAYTHEGIPAAVRDRQRRLVDRFGQARRQHLAWYPLAQRLVERCLADQIDEFERLYGRRPTHFDGHNHVHLSPNVLVARSLGRADAVRRADDTDRRRGGLARTARMARRLIVSSRFRTTDHFFPLANLHPGLGGSGLEEALALSGRTTVEIMVHPGWADQLELLLADDWSAALAGRPLGSFADLEARAPGRARRLREAAPVAVAPLLELV
jgi:predicted glycoside hydrolase/deacetylase ChbG (UPF0249 family)